MKGLILVFSLIFCLTTQAQYRGGGNNGQPAPQQTDNLPGFQKQKLFTGGSLNLGFSSYTTNLGLAPQLGYSLTDWLDAGIDLSFDYVSQRDPNVSSKLKSTIIGPGVFARIFPVSFLFVSGQFEYNFISQKYIPGQSAANQKYSYSVPSLLLGIGYAGGRMKGNNTYYYFSLSADFLRDSRSPYVDNFDRMMPIVRAGYNIGLFQGGGRSRGADEFYTP